MNRIAVEEDDQNEISSIHVFKYAGFDLFKSNNRRDENHEILQVARNQKHVHDKSVITKAKFSISIADPFNLGWTFDGALMHIIEFIIWKIT